MTGDRRINPRPRLSGTRFSTALVLVAVLLLAGCATEQPEPPRTSERTLVVTATAYNSLRSQTDEQPSIAAWGDRLEPGMKAVAVSRDLIREGLTRGTKLKIDGLEGEYVVLDKTSRRFKRRIDIYMGTDVEKAKEFGRKLVRIRWTEGAGDAGRQAPE